MTIEDRKRNARNNAQQAFWTVFASHFPEAASGDFPPDATIAFDNAIEQATQTWLDCNTPDLTSEIVVSSQTLPIADSLKCPHCQFAGEEETEHGGTFRFLSNVTAWREIVKVHRSRRKNKSQTVIVDGLSHTYDEDEETNERIECRKCLGEFRLSPDIVVEFI